MTGRKRIIPHDYSVRGMVIPRLWTLRRVPGCYRHLLPVAVMKRYQCVVVGRERGILTIAIAEPERTCILSILNMLSVLTGYTIFPVLVDPVRMRLLLRRIERMERSGCTPSDYLSRYYELQQRSMILFLITRYQVHFGK